MKDIKRMLAAVLIAAALFLFLFLFLKWDLLICILLCVGVYFGLFFLLRPVYRVGGINVETLPGGEEISRLLKEAREDLEGIETSIVEIKDERVQRDARTLYDSGKQILLYLEENPEKISLARRFFTYYLDLAAKLLDRYVDFQNTGIHSEEITEILQKTTEALPVLHHAFEKQFTNLMQGELMDVEVDIELLKNTLQMEDIR